VRTLSKTLDQKLKFYIQGFYTLAFQYFYPIFSWFTIKDFLKLSSWKIPSFHIKLKWTIPLLSTFLQVVFPSQIKFDNCSKMSSSFFQHFNHKRYWTEAKMAKRKNKNLQYMQMYWKEFRIRKDLEYIERTKKIIRMIIVNCFKNKKIIV
jgi:hypothetical protein